MSVVNQKVSDIYDCVFVFVCVELCVCMSEFGHISVKIFYLSSRCTSIFGNASVCVCVFMCACVCVLLLLQWAGF